MNIQLAIVILVIVAAALFIAIRIVTSLKRGKSPACASCPNEKTCASNQGRPPCALEELRPGRKK